MNGNVNNTSTGLMIALKKFSNSTTTINVAVLSQEMPSTSFVASVTPSAITTH